MASRTSTGALEGRVIVVTDAPLASVVNVPST